MQPWQRTSCNAHLCQIHGHCQLAHLALNCNPSQKPVSILRGNMRKLFTKTSWLQFKTGMRKKAQRGSKVMTQYPWQLVTSKIWKTGGKPTQLVDYVSLHSYVQRKIRHPPWCAARRPDRDPAEWQQHVGSLHATVVLRCIQPRQLRQQGSSDVPQSKSILTVSLQIFRAATAS